MLKGLWMLCALALLQLTACASSTPPPTGVSPEQVAHCRDLMYIARVPRGPPNWYLYDQCLQEAAGKKR